MKAAPANYGALVCYKDLGAISKDGLSGKDSYKVFLWKDPSAYSTTDIVLFEDE